MRIENVIRIFFCILLFFAGFFLGRKNTNVKEKIEYVKGETITDTIVIPQPTFVDIPAKPKYIYKYDTIVVDNIQYISEKVDIEHLDEEGNASSEKHCKCNMVEVEVLDYPTIVSAIVRDRYSQDDVGAIISNYQLCKDGDALDKSDEYEGRYNAYQAYRGFAKSTVKSILI